MYHYNNSVVNKQGDVLPGYFVQVVDQTTNLVVPIYADKSSTPIITISGIANMAKVDANGMASFYVVDGNYNLNLYAQDNTTLKGVYLDIPMLGGGLAVTADAVDMATITLNFSSASNFRLIVGGNRTLANPSNLVAGQNGFIRVQQDATGARTLAFGSYWKMEGGNGALSTGANAVDLIFFQVISTTEILASVRRAFSVVGPVNTSLPVITGRAQHNVLLAVSNGTWSNPPTSFAYQWKRNGTPIGGATASTYLTTDTDIGTNINADVIATYGTSSSTASSTTVGPITDPSAGYASYQGIVATRGLPPQQQSPGGTPNTNSMCRMSHHAAEAITSLKLAYVGFYSYVTDTNASGTGTWRASIEYPVGTFTQVLFSGGASGTCAPGAVLVSDACTVSIPKGAKFYTRTYQSNTVAMLSRDLSLSGGSDFGTCQLGTAGSPVSDLTMSGTIATGPTSLLAGPAAILGPTTRASVVIIGDSITAGYADTTADPTSGEPGAVKPSLNNIGYVDLSLAGLRAADYVAANTAGRRALATACNPTHLMNNCGINDMKNSGTTAAGLITIQQQLKTDFGSKPMVCATLSPVTTGTWADLPGQTVTSYEAERVSYNTTVRSTPAWLVDFTDPASAVESSLNSGKWMPNLTGDGLHPNAAGYDTIIASGTFTRNRFHP